MFWVPQDVTGFDSICLVWTLTKLLARRRVPRAHRHVRVFRTIDHMLMAEWCVFCVGLGLVFLVFGCFKSNLHGPSLCLHRSTMACCYFWVPLKSCVVDLSGFSHLPPILDARIPFHLLLLLSGDIEVHPGPSATFPCSVCHQEVADSERHFVVMLVTNGFMSLVTLVLRSLFMMIWFLTPQHSRGTLMLAVSLALQLMRVLM